VDAAWNSTDECPKILHRSMSFDLALKYEHVDHGWRALDKHKYDRDRKGGSDLRRKMKIRMPYP
jgi:hypothetical protein